MKGSTAGARYLAESANWLAWHRGFSSTGEVGTFMQAAALHWSPARFVEFVRWVETLPC